MTKTVENHHRKLTLSLGRLGLSLFLRWKIVMCIDLTSREGFISITSTQVFFPGMLMTKGSRQCEVILQAQAGPSPWVSSVKGDLEDVGQPGQCCVLGSGPWDSLTGEALGEFLQIST